MALDSAVADIVPEPEPLYRTEEEIWRASGDAYRAWRSQGRSEEDSLAAAADFYSYQLGRLRRSRITKVCAWCDRHMSGPDPSVATQISHGICADCLQRYFPGIEVSAEEE